jgi:hypothetical protein
MNSNFPFIFRERIKHFSYQDTFKQTNVPKKPKAYADFELDNLNTKKNLIFGYGFEYQF